MEGTWHPGRPGIRHTDRRSHTKPSSGMTTRRYKDLKGLKKENLRDNMSMLELALNMLAEATTTELTRTQNPQGLTQNQSVAREGGERGECPQRDRGQNRTAGHHFK